MCHIQFPLCVIQTLKQIAPFHAHTRSRDCSALAHWQCGNVLAMMRSLRCSYLSRSVLKCADGSLVLLERQGAQNMDNHVVADSTLYTGYTQDIYNTLRQCSHADDMELETEMGWMAMELEWKFWERNRTEGAWSVPEHIVYQMANGAGRTLPE